jgi:hypothetical protein
MGLHGLLQGVASISYIYMTFVPKRKHIYGHPRPVTGIAVFLYLHDVRT